MAYKINIKTSIRCPRHSTFDPTRHTEAAIKGACPYCHTLLRLLREVRAFELALASVKEEVETIASKHPGSPKG